MGLRTSCRPSPRTSAATAATPKTAPVREAFFVAIGETTAIDLAPAK